MKRFHKIFAFMLALVFLVMPLVACEVKTPPEDTTDSTPLPEDMTNNTTPTEQTTENTTAPAETTESTNPPAETTTPPDVPPADVKEYNIVMIGNSIIGSAKIPTPLLTIAAETGIKFNVTEYTIGGTSIQNVIPKARERLDEQLRNADAVFFQDTRWAMSEESMDWWFKEDYVSGNLRNMIDEIGPGPKYYFYLFGSQADLDWFSADYVGKKNRDGKYAYGEINGILKNKTRNGVHYDVEPFPMDHFTNMLIRLGYIERDSIFVKDDFHPNDMYGYFMSMIMYVTLTGNSCVGLLTDYLYLDSEWACLAGETKEEKLESLQKIQEYIDVMVAECQEALALYREGKINKVALTIYP